MWFKLFVVVRIPISILCLLGYSIGLAKWGMPLGLGCLRGLFALAPFALLLVVSIKLVRLRPRSLQLAALLLTVETAGAALLLVGGELLHTGKVELLRAASIGVRIALLWVLPNALLFYRGRGLSNEPAKEKPSA